MRCGQSGLSASYCRNLKIGFANFSIFLSTCGPRLEELLKRRLAAILAADVADFSAMAQRDELGTIRTVRGHLSAFETPVALHHGRIVKTLGDGFLAEFSSVVDAVACADVLQKVASDRNQSLASPDRAVFRMGVHAGDILEDDGDIFGDGVNIASRLESIAAPGTVTISSKVYEDVDRRLQLGFKDLGPVKLKNIEKPVHVFQLSVGDEPEPVQPLPDLPEKPSIAVLPMQTLGSDLEDEYLADGLTEDLTTVLSGVPWLFVIARNSAFTYKGLTADTRRIGAELGVRYVVEGSLRRSGDRVRISVQLVEAQDGHQIWAERYDSVLDDVFELQDRIVGELAKAIAPQIQAVEIQKSTRKRPTDLTAYDLYLNALGLLNSARISDAERFLEKAVEAYPDYASAKAVLSWCSTLKVAWQTSEDEDSIIEKGIALSQEALESPNCDIEAQAYAGYSIAFHSHDVERGMTLLANAVDACPSFAWAWVSRSYLETFFGDPELGVRFGEVALRLNPKDPLIFRIYLALANAHIALGQNSEALDSADRGLRRNSSIMGLRVLKTLALKRMGRLEDARNESSALIARHPEFRIARFLTHAGKFAHLRDSSEDLLTVGLLA
ncbi:adenylate/guanylate cyclase domain-containing protein [Lutimaribacter marinistellae]|uniref:Adenylate/guanylate cyclase domain-containing protein n=1 Tax=Lutimaribacter marinistellae TaxID=1820329 RepID=A0ABV7TBZ9_9RHOB